MKRVNVTWHDVPIAIFVLIMIVGPAWPETFRKPATGALTRPPPDLELISNKLKWDIEQAGRTLDEWQNDQTYVDTALLLCEHVGQGVFGRGENSYYCVRGGMVLFEHEIGKELFWWRMQDAWIPRPPAPPLKSKSRASEPWVGYQP